ncbi:cytochrome P450 [Coniophora puteana RWD-64-598 SS2]|uniref:Cytochrome P450 n=1 Tax=Coniophora puteana (strain RWD-64-598) TaxID=741705 RepID=A0A5M3MB98_CONPW|nr:cytochrome P450 [Coniophora puteana RWD-64-598 SS2]EIW76509.1 cytochrome P450 [Coniophora puteana RWD-64-598 SS2]
MSHIQSAAFPSTSWIPYLFLALLALYVGSRVIYNLFLSPLSSIPGPWYAAVSNLWMTTHVLRLQQCKTNHALFETYGPVVRVGPNKVIFKDLSAMRSVYSTHKFDKSSWYKGLLTNENDHAMTTLDHASHAIRRKGYAPHYVPANIAMFQPEANDYTNELLKGLDRFNGQVVDCLSLFRHYMVDMIITSSYGYRQGSIKKWFSGEEDPMSNAIADFPKRGLIRSAIPTWFWDLLCQIPVRRWRLLCDSDRIMGEFVGARVYDMRAQVNAEKLHEVEKVPLLQRLLGYKYTSTNENMPDHDIISELMGHMIAGSDTTSNTLSYMFWELSRRPDVMIKLQNELDAVMPDSRAIPDISTLQKLPYLNAFLNEGLRVYSAVPSPLERVVPPSSKGSPSDDCFDLMGYALPPGTIVSTQGWSMHHDAAVFHSPDTFLPDRWLESCNNPTNLSKMAQYMMPFGAGARICGGKNLAHMMLRIAIASVVRNFNVVAPAETNATSMDIKDSFVIFPAAMECKLAFHPR